MEIKELCEIFGSKVRCDALKALLADRKNRTASIDGLAGSAAAMLSSIILPTFGSNNTLLTHPVLNALGEP